MVNFHEDAYWPDNLSLFTVNCEHYQEPQKQDYGKILPFCKTLFLLQGVQENCKKTLFFEDPSS